MDFAEHLKNFKFNYTSSHPDIEYLNSSKVTHTISRGLSELYKIQPKNPVTFLANWLLNESRSSEITKQIEENKKIKEEVVKNYEVIKAKREQEAKILHEQNLKKQTELENFFNKIKQCRDFDDNLNPFCEELKKFVNATGVYVSVYDRKRKSDVVPEDDENGHLLEEKALRYIHHCIDHQFMKNKYLEPGNGITYKLIFPAEENTALDGENNLNQGEDNLNQNIEVTNTSNQNDSEKVKIKESLPEVYEKEVVMKQEIKFFREPRLGCYIAVDMSYNSSMNNDSLTSAISNFLDYRANIAAQEERRKQHELRVAELLKERVDIYMGNNYEEAARSGEDLPEPFNEEPVQLQDFLRTEKKLILSIDTLGQDRELSEEEIKFIHKTVRTIKSTWEKLEDGLLIKDRDLKIEFDEVNRGLNEHHTYDKIQLEEEKYIKEHFDSEIYKENPLKEEKLKAIQTELTRAKFILKSFLEDENITELFLKFSEFEFVKYEILFQNILYFIGVHNLDINEENTNHLHWKKAKKFWNFKVLEKLRDYKPIGPKVGKTNPYSYGNRILNNLESLSSKREEIRSEFFVLDRILEFMLLILKIRRDDILNRRDEITELIEKRNVAIANHKEREERRIKELEEAKNSFSSNNIQNELDADQENNQISQEFNEEEFLKKWDEDNPHIGLPEEVFYDEDCDFEIEKLGITI